MNLSLPVRHLGHQSIWQPEDITTLTWVVAAIVWDLCHHQALTNGCVPNVVHVNMFPWQWSLQSWERMACNVLRTTFLWNFSLGSKVVRIFCWQTETPTLALKWIYELKGASGYFSMMKILIKSCEIQLQCIILWRKHRLVSGGIVQYFRASGLSAGYLGKWFVF